VVEFGPAQDSRQITRVYISLGTILLLYRNYIISLPRTFDRRSVRGGKLACQREGSNTST
jgi:hypothetical protein